MHHELTLTLNTAEKRIQFLFSRGDDIVCFQDWAAPRNGVELLAPALDAACRQLGVLPAAIRRVAATVGPGSFTGIRLALSTASALARAVRARQAGLDSLQVLAAGAGGLPGQKVRVLVNARRGWVYAGDYVMDADGVPQRQGLPVLCALPAADSAGSRDDGAWVFEGRPDFVLGSGVTWYRSLLAPVCPPKTRLMPPSFDQPSASALLAATLRAQWQDGEPEPVYLRDCDAVENLDAIARTCGQNPEQARQTLKDLLAAPARG